MSLKKKVHKTVEVVLVIIVSSIFLGLIIIAQATAFEVYLSWTLPFLFWGLILGIILLVVYFFTSEGSVFPPDNQGTNNSV